MVVKAKIAKEVERTKHEMRDQKRGQSKVKRDSGLSNYVQHLKKWARFDGPLRTEASVALTEIQSCRDCGRYHPGKCWRKLGACLWCGSVEHHV